MSEEARIDKGEKGLTEHEAISSIINDTEEFRDTIATVDEKGKRVWLYPKKPSGNVHNWRVVVTVILLSILFGAKVCYTWPGILAAGFFSACHCTDHFFCFHNTLYCSIWTSLVRVDVSTNLVYGNGLPENRILD